MPNRRWLLAAAGLWLCCLGPSAPASPGGSARAGGGPYTIDVWETDEGLPQNSVIAMTQTRDGYLWLGTQSGLVRFDGIRFTEFEDPRAPELKGACVVLLFEDSRTNLWIGTQAGGLVRVTDGEVLSLPLGQGGADRRLVAGCEDATGAVWFYSAGGELRRFDSSHTNLFVVDQGRPSSRRPLVAEKAGPVLVGTDARLFTVPAQPDLSVVALPVAQSVPLNKLDLLLASERGGYWRLANGQVQKWVADRLECNWGDYPWGTAPVSAACEDREGNLLVGTLGAGVFWYDAQGKATALSNNEGLSDSFILSLQVDRERNLWIGTDGGGLNRVKRQVFTVLEATRGLVVQSVNPDAFGGLWLGRSAIGSNAKGAGFWRDGTLQWFETSQNMVNATVRSVFVDRAQQVWAGTLGGLYQLQAGRFRPAPGTAGLNRLGAAISALHQDRNGRLWVGTQGGLACGEGRTWRMFTTRDGLSSELVQAIADDAQGNLWIGTRGGGLNRLREGRFTVFRQAAGGLPGDDISSLLVDAEGVLWIGTFGNGLARWHNGQWRRFAKADGLVSNSIGYLVEDGLGFLWLGSNAGLMRVPKQALNDFAQGTRAFIACRTYGKSDGLPTSECTSGSQPGACRAPDGRLWFPTIKGLLSVNPAQLNPNTNPPPVKIESVLIEGQEQPLHALLRGPRAGLNVPAGREHLEFRYTSLNLAAPERARFRYWLEGHEKLPTEANNIRSAHYSKLPPGSYTFHVTACNEDGVWNPTGSALAITVQPPFWRTWWFLGASAATLLGSIVAAVHFFSTQRLQRQLERLKHQEALEKERARIARDIHDQLGANLTQVALLSELVESDKDFPKEVEAHAQQISRTARDTARALDEIVWAANPSNDTLDGLINYVCKHAQEYLAVAGLRYRLEVPTELPAAPIPPEVRHNIFLASKEAVTNVVRHAQASAVYVRLRLEPGQFSLEIEDNGRGLAGMDEQAAKARNGLRNMRKRMEDIGGQFAMSPGREGGTLIRLSAPLAIAPPSAGPRAH
jgi:ligand-binding sensor domain-containing protein/signal transduction histidine kinase